MDYNYSFVPGSQRLSSISQKLLQGQIPDDWELELNKIWNSSYLSASQQEVLFILFTKWAETDFEKAVQRSGKLGVYSHKVKSEILCQLAEKDPRKALSYYEKNKEYLVNHFEFQKSIVKNWAIISPEETLKWCLSLPQDIEAHQDILLTTMMEGISYSSELPKLSGYLDRIEIALGQVPSKVMEKWVETNYEEALNWLNQDGEREKKYQNAVIRGMLKNDLVKASDMMLNIPEKARYDLASSIVSEVKNLYGEKEALNWVTRLVPAGELDRIHLSPLKSLSRQYPEASRKWIENLPDSQGKDSAIIIYAQNINSHDLYDDALILIKKISNAKEQSNALQSTIRNWQQENPDAYNEWKKHSIHAEWLNSAETKNQP